MAELGMTDIRPEHHAEEKAKIARGERLMRVRGMANLSRSDVAQKYGISADTLKNWELGRHTGLTEQGAKRILTALKKAGIQCSMGWLLNGVGAAPVIIDELADNARNNSLDLAEGKEIYTALPAEVQMFCEQHPNAFSMRVIDDGMEPCYFVGDYVAGERCYQQDLPKIVGKYCIVETQMGEILLRRVRKGSKEGHYSLQCINILTAHPTPLIYDIELASAAPVILHWRMNY